MKFLLLIIFMALTADKMTEVADGDDAFHRIDTRRPPHELATGTAADAVNCRFEDGRAWPRLCVNTQPWGTIGVNMVPVGAVFSSLSHVATYAFTNFIIGEKYFYAPGKTTDLRANIPNGPVAGPGEFIATSTVYYLKSPGVPGSTVASSLAVVLKIGDPVGYARFNDPEDYDTQMVLTADWRNLVGEDGGRGRAWRVQAGNIPQAVPLNGHDVWDTTRLIQCFNGLVMLRQGSERHYFSATRTVTITDSDATAETLTVTITTLANGLVVKVAGITGATGTYYVREISGGTISLYDTLAHATAGGATGRFNVTVTGETGTLSVLAVDPATARIQLNEQPNWADGDKVVFYTDNAVPGGSLFMGTTPPQNATAYFVKHIGTTQIELYTNPSLLTQVSFTGALGRFWIERDADFPGFYGNAAPPLVAQPDGFGKTVWEAGFVAVPVSVIVTGTDASTGIVTAPNHRLLPGDNVTVTGLNTTGPVPITTAYVYPVSDHAVKLYTTQLGALAQDPATLIAQVGSETGTLTKVGASGLPMPGGREGAYYQNRLIIVNGRDTVAISDPLDVLHFSPFTAAVTANLGESDSINAVWPMGTNDAVLVLKENSVGLINNFSGGPSNWTFTNLTREYGCIAPLSVAQVGADVWFLSRKGVASVAQTSNGVLQGVADPVSKPMKKYIDRIDWRYAKQACGGYWNNRYFVALPLKGQGKIVLNNGVLVHNFLNVTTSYSAGSSPVLEFGWEGLWSGATLLPFALARLDVYGDERMCFLDYSGQVRWLGDGWADGTSPIPAALTTRRYTGGSPKRVLWLSGLVTVDAWAPNLTVNAIFPGVNEQQTVIANKVFDKTKYLVYGAADYNPAAPTTGTFNAPYREDYQPSAAELLAGAPDLHQNHPLPFRLRRQDWGIQIQVTNISGSARVQSVEVGGNARETTSAEAV